MIKSELVAILLRCTEEEIHSVRVRGRANKIEVLIRREIPLTYYKSFAANREPVPNSEQPVDPETYKQPDQSSDSSPDNQHR